MSIHCLAGLEGVEVAKAMVVTTVAVTPLAVGLVVVMATAWVRGKEGMEEEGMEKEGMEEAVRAKVMETEAAAAREGVVAVGI